MKELHIYRRSPEHTFTSWCGLHLQLSDDVFWSVEHAVQVLRHESGRVPCERCVRSINDMLRLGTALRR